MKKVCMVVVFMAFVFTGLCLADEIAGKVSSVDSAKKMLQISGVRIQATDAWIENEQDYPLALNKLVPGDYIEIDGKFIGSSKMQATKIERTLLQCAAVKGRIASVNPQKREMIISGIKIKVPVNIWLEGPNRVKIPLELFAPGYSVNCKGNWTANSELTAFKITVE